MPQMYQLCSLDRFLTDKSVFTGICNPQKVLSYELPCLKNDIISWPTFRSYLYHCVWSGTRCRVNGT